MFSTASANMTTESKFIRKLRCQRLGVRLELEGGLQISRTDFSTASRANTFSIQPSLKIMGFALSIACLTSSRFAVRRHAVLRRRA